MKLTPLVVLALGLVAACGGSSSSVAGESADIVSGSPSSGESCTATLRWLQKDAYKNTGGRTTSAWPPHTTTQLDVHCVNAAGSTTLDSSTFRENHGSKPGQVDANGKSLLDEVKHVDARGTRTQVNALLESYKGCECDPATEFLSMDTVKKDASMQKVLAGFADYAAQHLVCSGTVTAQDVASKLTGGDFEGVLVGLKSCAWAEGFSYEGGLTAAAHGVLIDLSKYHVCNNDAVLEASLFERFASDGTAPKCDSASKACQGPKFFYKP